MMDRDVYMRAVSEIGSSLLAAVWAFGIFACCAFEEVHHYG
jgi:hypothetical protein